MSLSNIDKKHADQLILSINGGNNINHNSLEIVRKNYIAPERSDGNYK
jgi:hypothetical protein